MLEWKAFSRARKQMWMYSSNWMNRKVKPSSQVAARQRMIPRRLPRRIDSSAQWTVKLDETRIAVLTPATPTGRLRPAGGQGPELATTRTKKYEAKNAPKSITSET